MKRKEPKPEFGEVYGLMLMVRVRKEPAGLPEVLCPKGGALFYGQVVACGDGYDTDAKSFRRVPQIGSVVTFEENGEHVEGHYFFVGEQEYRIIHLDSVIVAFPQADGNPSE